MPKGIRNLQIAVGEKHLTHFGGIFLIHWFCKKLKLRWYLQNYVKFPKRSSRYYAVDLLLAIIYAIIAGIQRLSRTKILQGNGSFQKIVGLKSYPYSSSLTRFLRHLDSKTIQSINRVHDQLRLKMFYFCGPRTSLLFDLDSTVLIIYGKLIEGAEIGYNPKKKGGRSYHPLVCFESHTKDYWHGVLRPGNAASSTGAVEFLEECFAKIPPRIYRIRIRADSGFYNKSVVSFLDERGVGYAIVARMTSRVKNTVGGLRYQEFRKDWETSEFSYKPLGWKENHRFVVVRRPIPEKPSEQPTLFTLKRYAYHVFVTNLPLQPAGVWYFYKGRAGIEINIKHLGEDFALAKIPTRKFQANEAYFYLLLFAYNLINWFKQTCLPQKFQSATLQTIRTELLVLPAKLVKSKNRNVLKLPAEYLSEHTLNQIIAKIRKLKLR